ncbi:glycosyltransferase family 9 protein [Labedaea rhizosphaerae]|uniref:ADP-heptose:LPS heptosyltransferase n=1 Tax=Labedaea rhizosphaerae TaxID=598644 RepID=A0A4R6SB99_LABRH|nr:glycosyltransferase family 9 protein [Labedaea rhizosphaerae]TDP96727.1 ADP-heptose:LPS heptosyltransferase [Labedaea rhizosphaerae]
MTGGIVFVLRALGLGDLLTAVPALRAIRAAWPDDRLVLGTPDWLAPVADLIGGIDRLWPLADLAAARSRPLPRPRVAVNLHGKGPQSTAALRALRPRRLLAYNVPHGPQWSDGFPERERWCALLRWYGIPADPADFALARPAIASPAPKATVLHAGAKFGSRRWPVDRFAEVARELAARGADVVLTGTVHERDRCQAIADRAGLAPDRVLAGHLGLDALAALIADASLLVSADTGVAHLSYAFGTPSVVLFGPSTPQQWGPPAGGPHVALTDATAPRGDPFSDEPDPALLGVGVADVLAAVDELVAPQR